MIFVEIIALFILFFCTMFVFLGRARDIDSLKQHEGYFVMFIGKSDTSHYYLLKKMNGNFLLISDYNDHRVAVGDLVSVVKIERKRRLIKITK
jgi:hypothetical protein